jgi:regulatory protein
MTVVSVKTGADPEVLNVGLQDGSSFFIRTSYLELPSLVASLSPGNELSEEEESVLLRAGERLRAEHSSLRLIALREHSRAELELKLRKRGFGERDTAVVLDRLVDEGLVDDERYAELWVESRIIRRNEGPMVLIARLRAHGVSRDIARAVVSRVAGGEVEVSIVRRFLAAEGGLPSREDPALRERLRKAGFSSQAVREAFDQLG